MQQVGNIPLRFRILKLQMAMMSPRSPTESPPPSPLWSQSPELLQPYLERPLTTCIELQPQRVWHWLSINWSFQTFHSCLSWPQKTRWSVMITNCLIHSKELVGQQCNNQSFTNSSISSTTPTNLNHPPPLPPLPTKVACRWGMLTAKS